MHEGYEIIDYVHVPNLYIDYKLKECYDKPISYRLYPISITIENPQPGIASNLTFECDIRDGSESFATVYYTIFNYNDGKHHKDFDKIDRSINTDYIESKMIEHGCYAYGENTGMPSKEVVFDLLKKFASAINTVLPYNNLG